MSLLIIIIGFNRTGQVIKSDSFVHGTGEQEEAERQINGTLESPHGGCGKMC